MVGVLALDDSAKNNRLNVNRIVCRRVKMGLRHRQVTADRQQEVAF